LAQPETFEGRFEYENNLIYISFPAKNPKKMYILQAKTIKNWKIIKYLRGTYISDSETHPEAGVIFCEKVESYQDGLDKFKETIPIEIQHELLHKQFKINDDPITDEMDMQKHPMYKHVNKIKEEFSGTYQSFYLSNQANKKILMSIMTITENGKVKFYTEDNRSPYEGYVIVKSSSTLYIRVHYQPKPNTYKFIITLKVLKKGLFIGAYGGDFQANPAIPGFGRVVFNKISEGVDTKEPFAESFEVAQSAQMKVLRSKYLGSNEKVVLDFLRGISEVAHYNDIIDSPYHIFKGTKLSLDSLDSSQEYTQDIIADTEPKNKHHAEEFIAPYVGKYACYIVSHFNVEPKYRVQLIKMEIQKDGNVKAYSIHNNNYTGRFYLDSEANCIILTIQRNNVEIIKHVLEKIPYASKEETDEVLMLRGTYTGIGSMNSPIGGRILLIKKTEGDIKPRDFDLSDILKSQNLELKDYLLPFFMGMEDNMVESYPSFFESWLLPRFSSKNQDVESVSGLYKIYRLRNNRKSISIVPLVIYPDGTVKMKSGRSGNKKYPYTGKIVLTNGEIVSILFFKRGTEESFSYAMFNKSIEQVGTNNTNFIGMFTSLMPHDRRVFSSRIVLIYEEKDTSGYDQTLSTEIFIPKWGDKTINDQYEEMDKMGILTYLASEENNMLRTGQGPRIRSLRENNGYKKKFDYGKVFFIAAVQALKEGKNEESKSLWQHAKDQGFRDKVYFEKVINEAQVDRNFFIKD
jgi:hypothetical protein